MELRLGTDCSLTRMPEAGDTYIGLAVVPGTPTPPRGTPVTFAGDTIGHVHYFEWQDPQPVLQLYGPLPLPRPRALQAGMSR